MTGGRLIVMGRDASGIRAFALDKELVSAERRESTEAEALSALNADGARLVRIGDGCPDTVPCAVLPTEGDALPAVVQDQPADILDGWVRLSIAGFLARHENWDGVLCVLQGDISHWVHISANEIVSCASFLTHRLIATLGGSEVPDPAAMADSQSRPERLAQYLRQAEITGNAAAITGTLIGAELAASRVYWLGQLVGVIAPQGAASIHAQALSAQGVPVTSYTAEDLIPDGLAALAKHLDGEI